MDQVPQKKTLSSRLEWLTPGSFPLRRFQEEIHQPKHCAFVPDPRAFRDNIETDEALFPAHFVAFWTAQSFRKNSQIATNRNTLDTPCPRRETFRDGPIAS